MTRRGVNTRSSSSSSRRSNASRSSTTSVSDQALLAKGVKVVVTAVGSASARTAVLESTSTTTNKDSKASTSIAAATAPTATTTPTPTVTPARSSARLGSKRKLSPSMERLADNEEEAEAEVITTTATNNTQSSPNKEAKIEEKKKSRKGQADHQAVITTTANNNDHNGDATPPATEQLCRRVVERLITVSKIYLDLPELEVYDEKLHRSLDRMIERFDAAETDMDTTPDDLLPTVTERHLELLNVRMKLLKLNGNGNGGNTTDSFSSSAGTGPTKTSTITTDTTTSTDSKSTTTTTATTPTDTDLNGSSDSGCFYCRGDHASEQCTVFPLARRSNIIKKRKRCFRCLRKFTEGHRCEGRCGVCDRQHHVSLCKQDPATFTKKAGSSLTPAERTAKKAAKEAAKRAAAATAAAASASEQSTSSATTTNSRPLPPPPITEPPLPSGAEAQLLMMVTYPSPTSPEPLSMNLFTVNPLPQKPITYMPGITVNVVSPAGSALCRVMLNHTSGLGSFVSPRLLARLNVRPTRLPQAAGIPVHSYLGSATVKEYAVLEVRSLYRPAHRFRHVFYVLDVNRHRFHLPSPAVTRLAEGRGLRLSHAYDADRTANAFDMVMGRSDLPLTGFICAAERMVELRDRAAGIEARAYYTHFGYLLIGGEKENRSVSFSGGGSGSSRGGGSGSGGGGGSGSGSGGSRGHTGGPGSGRTFTGPSVETLHRALRGSGRSGGGGGGRTRSAASAASRRLNRDSFFFIT
ncbi:hypothetical protein TYRP_022942 [Tyrophagus putrescentiae]|nr:hypothetical protein TYRP_022942 [Tyrophagus putrescentiae]